MAIAHIQGALAVIDHLCAAQGLLQVEGVDALAAQNDVVAATVTEGVIAVAAFEKVIAAPPLNQVIAVTADDKSAALVRLGVAIEVLDPGVFPRRVGQVGEHEGRVPGRQVIERRIEDARHRAVIAIGQVADPGRDIGNRKRHQIPRGGGVVIVETDNVVGSGRLMRVMHTQRRQIKVRTVQGAKHRVVLKADIKHVFRGFALGGRSKGNVIGIAVKPCPVLATQICQAVDGQAAQAVATDQHVLAAQPLRAGKGSHFAQQQVKGIGAVVFRIIGRADRGKQIADGIANGIADQRLTRATGAAKPDADRGQLAIGAVLAEDFHLSTAIARLLTEKGAALIDLACVPQLISTDGGPAGFFDGFAGEFFRVRVPGNARHHALGISATEHGLDQGGGQPKAHAVLLVAHGKAIIEVVIAVKGDGQSIGDQRR